MPCAAWHQPERDGRRPAPQRIGPGSRRVDESRRGKYPACSDLQVSPSARSRRAGVHHDASAARLGASQESLMQTIDVQFHGVRLDEGARQHNRAAASARGRSSSATSIVSMLGTRAAPPRAALEQLQLIRTRDRDHAARRQQRMVAEARRAGPAGRRGSRSRGGGPRRRRSSR